MRCFRRIVMFMLVTGCAGARQHGGQQAPEVSPAGPALAVVRGAAEPPRVQPPEHWTLESLARGAKRLDQIGATAHPVATRLQEAQAFFDQGLGLVYGFNHDEAARSFARAAELDPSCAMCFWGTAYALGPNYDFPMRPDRAAAAWEALTLAQEEMRYAPPVEQALIGALSARFLGPEAVDPAAMQPLHEAYASAMRRVARQFPDDLDVQTLFAEALMNVRPRRLWSAAGAPAQGTGEIVIVLESVLRRAPQHIGANHLYVLALEASRTPVRAEASADRLGRLAPGAGHLVHMPARIYQRIGRYSDASEANRRGILADQGSLEELKPVGNYLHHVAHHYGFLAYSSAMEGNSAAAAGAARQCERNMARNAVGVAPDKEVFLAEPLLVWVRFGHWEDILAEPAPDPKYPVLTALYHHARGMAHAATGKLEQARSDADLIGKLREELPSPGTVEPSRVHALLALAQKVVDGRIADAEQRPDAFRVWAEAVVLEDGLAHGEPADWFSPTRHYLGAALLDAGRPAEAQAVYVRDLELNPGNGWALYGLSRALSEQHLGARAKRARLQFEHAWRGADVTLTRSAY